MGCNSLLNNYCFAIILIAKMLVEKYNSWNECIGNDIFCLKETFSDFMWLFTGGLVGASRHRHSSKVSCCSFVMPFRRVASKGSGLLHRFGFAIKETHVSPVGIIQTMPNHLNIFETWRDLLKAKRFHLYLSSCLSTVIRCYQHIPKMGDTIHQETKWIPGPGQLFLGTSPRQVSLSLLCFVPGLQLRRCPFGLSCCDSMFRHLSVSKINYGVFYGCVEWVGPKKLPGPIA